MANYGRESELVASFLQALPAYATARSELFVAKKELSTGHMIADVALLLHDGSQSALGMKPLTARQCVVLAVLRGNGPTEMHAIERRCCLNGRDIDRLFSLGLVRWTQHGLVSLCQPCNGTIIAVEAKLMKWRQALKQASSYGRFADESFVLLPEPCAEVAARHPELFKSHGVGLLTIRAGGIVTLIASARLNKHDWRREFVYSRLISGSLLAA